MAKSFARSVASGLTAVFSVPFPYLDKTHVSVFVDGTLLDPSAYSWPTTASVELTAGAPVAGAVVERRRITPADVLTTFTPGNLEAADLNSGVLQPLYLAQEADDRGSDLVERAWVTAAYGLGGTITKGTAGQVPVFDASGNLSGTSVLPVPDGGAGFMLQSTYDPEEREADVYDLAEHHGIAPLPVELIGFIGSDFQPQNSSPEQIAIAEQAFTNIGLTHPRIHRSHRAGDLVDQGTVDGTGATPLWGFQQEQSAALRAGLRSSTSGTIPGNHDLNGTGAGAHAKAWSIDEYRRWHGPGFWYSKMGNVIDIYVGDVGGQNSGEVLPGTWEAVFKIAKQFKGCNVWLYTHQPANGVYNGYTYPDNNNAVQAAGSTLTDLYTAHQAEYGNIVSVYYGHIGSAFVAATSSIDIWGTRHWGGQMAIPSFWDEDSPLVYNTYRMAHLATEVVIKRWDARFVGAAAYLGEEHDVVLTMKYPLDLGLGVNDFDGRWALPKVNPIMEESGKIVASLSDFMAETSPGVFGVPSGTIARMLVLEVNDDNNSAPGGFGVGVSFRLPGSVGENVGGSLNTITPGSDEGGLITMTRIVSADQIDFQTRCNIYIKNGVDASANPNALQDVFELRPQGSSVAGLMLKLPNAAFRVSADLDFTSWSASDTTAKARLDAVGTVYCARAGTTGLFQRLGSDGYFHEFYRDATRVGGIQGVGGSVRLLLTTTVFFAAYAGSPEGSLSGAVGSEVNDITNGVKYMKKTGTGNTGWKLVTQAV